jgi:hypothetical protein
MLKRKKDWWEQSFCRILAETTKLSPAVDPKHDSKYCGKNGMPCEIMGSGFVNIFVCSAEFLWKTESSPVFLTEGSLAEICLSGCILYRHAKRLRLRYFRGGCSIMQWFLWRIESLWGFKKVWCQKVSAEKVGLKQK